MNMQRRKAIAIIRGELETLNDRIRELMEEEQEAFDNMPESLQESERGQALQSAIDSLGYAADELEAALENLDAAGE